MSVMEEKEPRRRTLRSFSPEFKREAIKRACAEGMTDAGLYSKVIAGSSQESSARDTL